jgi:hypothetical protein
MLLKLLVLAIIAPMLWAAFFVFDAASNTSLALGLATSARATQSAVIREHLLNSAENALENAWSQPAAWHAGASEALSGIYFYRGAAANDPALLDRSVKWAEKTVTLAPVQPHAWARLAALSEAGHRNPLCDVRGCLDNSWMTGPMIDPETACERLQLAHQQGLLLDNDPRIESYVRSGVQSRQAAQCLASFMSSDQLFRALLLRARH